MEKALIKLTTFSAFLLLTACSSLYQSSDTTPSAVQPIAPATAADVTGAATATPTGEVPETATTTTDAGTTATPVGGSMSALDQEKLSHALDAPLGQPTTWVSTANGATYTVVPTAKVTINGNPYCRKYNVKTERGSQSNAYTGTACVGADSTWKVANQSIF